MTCRRRTAKSSSGSAPVPEIIVTGGTKTQRPLVKEAALFYLNSLFRNNRGMLSEVVLEIELVKDLFEYEGTKGDCAYADERVDPREFEVRLDSSMTNLALVATLAHEIVHVKQYVSGEMRDTALWNICIWRSKKIDWKKLDYFEHPWEIEAYGREDGLVEKFVHTNGYSRTRWYRKDPDYDK